MAEPFATATELAALWRPLTAAEQERANALLVIASATIRAEVSDVDDRIAADPERLDPAIPRWVACQMAKRVMQSNADMPPVSQQQQAIGSVSLGYTLVNPTGDLYISKSELKMLGGSQQKASTISMIRGR